MSVKKQWLYLIFVIFGLALVMLTLRFVMFSKSSVTCAKITRITRDRSGASIRYFFDVNNRTYLSGLSTISTKNISIDSLKKIDCIQLEYSNYSPFWNRIIDKRILK